MISTKWLSGLTKGTVRFWSSTFQGIMNENFKPYLRKFFDDILVFSKGWVEHLEHLEIVLEVLLQNQLYAKT